MNDYSHYAGGDRHANSRDRKREKNREDAAMRGKRSVFEIQKARAKRDRDIIRRMKDDD